MQKMSPSVDDIKIILYHHLWEIKFCSSFAGILLRFLRGRQYFYTRTSFLFAPPFYSFYLFQKYIKTQENPPTWNKLIRFLLRKLHNTSFSFRYIFASYHLLFSILSGYGAMFMHLSRKSDSKKLFGILRTSEYSVTSINCSSVT